MELYTHSLQRAIEFFGSRENARFRFVTKYNDIDSLFNLGYNGHTEIRFSITTSSIIEASSKVAEARYPIGFLVAPVFIFSKWKEEYYNLSLNLRSK